MDSLAAIATASQEIHDLNARLYLIRRPSESLIGKAYCLLEDYGLLDTVWHAGRPSLSMVLADAALPTRCYYAFIHEDIITGSVNLAGIGWAHDIFPISKDKFRASVGMAFFQAYQDRKTSKEFCSMAIEDGFQNLNLEVQFGYAPLANKAACLFHRLMGFEILCVAPLYSSWHGEPCAVQMSVMTRERWEKTQRESRSVPEEAIA